MNTDLICQGTYTVHWPTAAGDTCRRCGQPTRPSKSYGIEA